MTSIYCKNLRLQITDAEPSRCFKFDKLVDWLNYELKRIRYLWRLLLINYNCYCSKRLNNRLHFLISRRSSTDKTASFIGSSSKKCTDISCTNSRCGLKPSNIFYWGFTHFSSFLVLIRVNLQANIVW